MPFEDRYSIVLIQILFDEIFLVLQEHVVYHKLVINFFLDLGFSSGSNGKESACNVGDPGLIPGSGRSPGEGNGNPLQDSCLENSMDRGAWWATVHEKESNTTEILHFFFNKFERSLIKILSNLSGL